jgi:chaperone modulatory protein CbpM
VVRARRLARLESTFDADPQLAGLTTDLIEEVTALRQRLRQLEALLGR